MVSVWLIVVLALLGGHSGAVAQESPAGSAPLAAEAARRAADHAIVSFNTGIQTFSSWEAFATAVVAPRGPDALGTCYAHAGGRVDVTKEALPQDGQAQGWQQTPGGGWAQRKPDRTFVEYRFNAKDNALVWIEGVSPRFFFAYTKKMCVLPLEGPRPQALP
jgi:hypothetical protein